MASLLSKSIQHNCSLHVVVICCVAQTHSSQNSFKKRKPIKFMSLTLRNVLIIMNYFDCIKRLF